MLLGRVAPSAPSTARIASVSLERDRFTARSLLFDRDSRRFPRSIRELAEAGDDSAHSVAEAFVDE
jgi:hypothetical protein